MGRKQPKAVNPICFKSRTVHFRVTKHRSDDDEKAVPLFHSNGLFVVFSEVGAGQEIRHQTPGQPRRLDVALGLSFKTPTQLNAVELAVRSSASGKVSRATCGSYDPEFAPGKLQGQAKHFHDSEPSYSLLNVISEMQLRGSIALCSSNKMAPSNHPCWRVP